MDATPSAVDGCWFTAPIRYAAIPDLPGVYQIWLRLPHERRIIVGRQGAIIFPQGDYIYSGSARRGLCARLGRHLARRKERKHWHIDYLRSFARVVAVRWWCTDRLTECAVHAELRERWHAAEFPRGFGASDCRCAAHLLYLPLSEGIRRAEGK